MVRSFMHVLWNPASAIVQLFFDFEFAIELDVESYSSVVEARIPRMGR